MEHRGFEPLTSTLRTLRATNCANAPYSLRAGDAAASTDNRYNSTTVCKLQALFLLFPAMCYDCIIAERDSDEPIDDQRAVCPHSRRHSFFQLLPAFSIPSGEFNRKYSCRMGYHGLAESLHISQPRCSSGLMELEQKLGKPLFLCGKRKITLSADAP